MAYCRKCGSTVNTDYTFCENCGCEIDKEDLKEMDKKVVIEEVHQSTPELPTNTIGIVGFVLAMISIPMSCLCLLPIFSVPGLICSIMGLVKSKTLEGSGKGLSIAGIAVAAVSILFWCFMLFVYFVYRLDVTSTYYR